MFSLAVGPRVIRFGQPMLDTVLPADVLEDMDEPAPVLAALRLNELNAVVGQHGVDIVWHGPDQGLEEVALR